MDLSQIPLFALADRRLAWVTSRQAVLSENIANADTPHWRARDVSPFAAALGTASIGLAATEPGHFAGKTPPAAKTVLPPGERSPDGNGIQLDKELAKVADTDTAHEIALGVTKSYLGMFRTAIGR